MIYSLYIMRLDSGSIILKRRYISKFMINEHLIMGALSAINSLFKEGELGEINSIRTKKFRNIYYFDEGKNLMIIVIVPLSVRQSEILNQTIYDVCKKMVEINGNNDFHFFSGNITEFQKNFHYIDEIVVNYDTDWLCKDYPNKFIKKIKIVQEGLIPSVVKDIGIITGAKIASKYKSSSQIIRIENLKGELKEFSIYKFKNDNEFIFESCPLCEEAEKTDNSEPSCLFLAGFIQGFLNTEKVMETRCRRAGDSSCNFIIC